MSLNHYAVPLNLTHCKSTIVQFKKTKIKTTATKTTQFINCPHLEDWKFGIHEPFFLHSFKKYFLCNTYESGTGVDVKCRKMNKYSSCSPRACHLALQIVCSQVEDMWYMGKESYSSISPASAMHQLCVHWSLTTAPFIGGYGPSIRLEGIKAQSG